MLRRYAKLSVLGRGGMGVAFRSWDTIEQCVVVRKEPREDLFDQPRLLERFDREARLAASLRHEHIVPIIDRGVEDGVPFYVMPFMPGGSLRKRVGRRKKMKKPRFHLWLPGIASALDFAYANGGTLHHDVKPSNILFDAGWTARLGDFGVAQIQCADGDTKPQGTGKQLKSVPGSMRYTAPERLQSPFQCDGRADQYSLAVTVYELACGETPFVGRMKDLHDEILNDAPPRLKDRRRSLPDSICDAVHKALSKNPDDRFPSCAAFAEAVLADLPPPSDDMQQARMLCPTPGCETLLQFASRLAGAGLQCPRCKCHFTVDRNLAYLELPSDRKATDDLGDTVIARGFDLGAMHERDVTDDSFGGSASAFLDFDAPARPRRLLTLRLGKKTDRWMFRAIGILALIAVILGVGVWRAMDWSPACRIDKGKEAAWVDHDANGVGRVVVPTPIGWKLKEAKAAFPQPQAAKLFDELFRFEPDNPNGGPAVVGRFAGQKGKDNEADALEKACKDFVEHCKGKNPPLISKPDEPSIRQFDYELEEGGANALRRCFARVIDGRIYIVEAWAFNRSFKDAARGNRPAVDAEEAAKLLIREMKATKPIALLNANVLPGVGPSGLVPAVVRIQKDTTFDGGTMTTELSVPASFRIAGDLITNGQWHDTMSRDAAHQTNYIWRSIGKVLEELVDFYTPDSRKKPKKFSREQAQDFCERLTRQQRREGTLPPNLKYVVPTEAQVQVALRSKLMPPVNETEWRVDAQGKMIAVNSDKKELKSAVLRVALVDTYERDWNLFLQDDLQNLPDGKQIAPLQVKIARKGPLEPLAAQKNLGEDLIATSEASFRPKESGVYSISGNAHGGSVKVKFDGKLVLEGKGRFKGKRLIDLKADKEIKLRIEYRCGRTDPVVELNWERQN